MNSKLFVLLMLLGTGFACGAEDEIAARQAAIWGPTSQVGSDQHKAVFALHRMGSSGSQAICNATFIAPRVAITAAHCLPTNIPDAFDDPDPGWGQPKPDNTPLTRYEQHIVYCRFIDNANDSFKDRFTTPYGKDQEIHYSDNFKHERRYFCDFTKDPLFTIEGSTPARVVNTQLVRGTQVFPLRGWALHDRVDRVYSNTNRNNLRARLTGIRDTALLFVGCDSAGKCPEDVLNAGDYPTLAEAKERDALELVSYKRSPKYVAKAEFKEGNWLTGVKEGYVAGQGMAHGDAPIERTLPSSGKLKPVSDSFSDTHWINYRAKLAMIDNVPLFKLAYEAWDDYDGTPYAAAGPADSGAPVFDGNRLKGIVLGLLFAIHDRDYPRWQIDEVRNGALILTSQQLRGKSFFTNWQNSVIKIAQQAGLVGEDGSPPAGGKGEGVGSDGLTEEQGVAGCAVGGDRTGLSLLISGLLLTLFSARRRKTIG